jgi:hypothetical protein
VVEPFGCLLPPPMTATLAALMVQCLSAASDAEKCGRRAGDARCGAAEAGAGGSRGGDCQTLRPRCVICLGQFRIVSTCRVVDRSHPNRAMVYFDTSFPFTAYIHFTEIHMYFHCKIDKIK